jgi:glycosyltransferase involved in cell wall biosynthesis
MTMRFCFLMPQREHYSPVTGGAVSTVTANVSKELQSMGHCVDVIAPNCDQPGHKDGQVHFISHENTHGIVGVAAHFEARFRGWDSPHEGRFYSKALKTIEFLRPDVLVLANDLERISAVRRLLPTVRIVSWIHNECRSRRARAGGLGQVDAFLCCSDYIKDWLTREYRLDGSRAHTAHAGVDRCLFYPSVDPRPEGALRVLFTGRLDRNKGVDVAVDTVARLRERGVPIQLSVAGNTWFYPREGSDRDPFQNGLRKAMKESGTDWLGHVPRRFLPDVMRSHDVALVLSRSQEPFGLVVLESMASGLAVIASHRGGLGEACGGAAMVVEPEDRSTVAALLDRLSKDRTELNRWRTRSLERMRTASWSDTAKVLCRAVGASPPAVDRGKGLVGAVEGIQLGLKKSS